MSADDVAGWLRELLRLSRVDERSDLEESRMRELCCLLRGAGFSNQWLQDFTNGKLRTGNLKRWTGGVEVKDVSGKERLMGELQAFLDGGYEVKDLGEYVKAKETIGKVPISFSYCADFASGLGKLDTDVIGFLRLNEELAHTGLSVTGIIRTNELRKKLDEKELTIDVEETIFEAANRHGDGEEILKMIAATESLYSLTAQAAHQKELSDEFAENIIAQKTTYNSLILETASYRGHIEVAKTLLKSGFDNNACNELIAAADTYGSAPGVIGAVNKYNSLAELNQNVEEKKAEVESMDRAVKRLQGENEALLKQNAEANQLLGQIDERYSKNKYLLDVSGIVNDPTGVKIPPVNLAKVCVTFLSKLIECAEASPVENSRLISAVGYTTKSLLTSLQNYLRGS